ncbi:ketosteroid isomerase-related protein [Longilinea arvoryzae]|uniref:Ketosteroid isomerase-related protein n=1 Tax=Longilinea arvoryzae TaxID=360412 RepID=A0A0S7BHR7_9CHLR|nr:nuclear transport factor 2 family protein [Longilinea arvoryzae]GAP13403.1 ketosteroid isomerase-related protein [Longilinea arvoryzae]
MEESVRAVLALWDAFDHLDFDAAGALLADDFVCEWPQSGERIRGRANFVAVNAHYPGRWRIRVLRVVAGGDEVVTEVEATWGEEKARAISFFRVRNGRICHLREFWPEPYPAQAWRAAWVEQG